MSETNHVESFKCPSCGAPIEIRGAGERTVKCPFCGEPAPVPENLLSPNGGQATGGVFEMPQMGSLGAAVEMAQVMKQIKLGNKIEAIKVYRQMFPVSLQVAKTQVEAIERSMAGAGSGQPMMMNMNFAQATAIPVSSPVTTRSSNAGCIVTIFILVLTLGILGAVFFSVNQQVSSISGIDVSSLQKSVKATVLAQIPLAATKSPTRAPAPTPTPPYAVQALTVGKEGSGAGQFANANRIGIDAKGNVYVGEYNGGRVQVFDRTGKYLSQFFSGNAQSKLTGLAVDFKGTVYTADGTLISRFNGLTGEKLGQLAYTGGPGFGELAIAPDGGVGALWYPTRDDGLRGKGENFVQFDASGKVTLVISAPLSSRTGELEHTNAIAFDNGGNLYIASYVSNAVFKFGPDGKYINRFGSPGNAPDQLSMAYSMAIDSRNQVYIKDAQSVIVYGSDGRFIRRIALDRARGIVFDNNDALWAIESTVLSKYVLGR